MNQEFRERLIKHLDFLEAELDDYLQFKKLTREEYFKDRDKRRSVERWIENIINSTVDIAKIILTAEGMRIPETYREIVLALSYIEELKPTKPEKVSRWVRFRNIIAHDYLDIKWNSISKFIKETEILYKNFMKILKRYLKNKIKSEAQ